MDKTLAAVLRKLVADAMVNGWYDFLDGAHFGLDASVTLTADEATAVQSMLDEVGGTIWKERSA
jgi:hypothetical protein